MLSNQIIFAKLVLTDARTESLVGKVEKNISKY